MQLKRFSRFGDFPIFHLLPRKHVPLPVFCRVVPCSRNTLPWNMGGTTVNMHGFLYIGLATWRVQIRENNLGHWTDACQEHRTEWMDPRQLVAFSRRGVAGVCCQQPICSDFYFSSQLAFFNFLALFEPSPAPLVIGWPLLSTGSLTIVREGSGPKIDWGVGRGGVWAGEKKTCVQ